MMWCDLCVPCLGAAKPYTVAICGTWGFWSGHRTRCKARRCGRFLASFMTDSRPRCGNHVRQVMRCALCQVHVMCVTWVTRGLWLFSLWLRTTTLGQWCSWSFSLCLRIWARLLVLRVLHDAVSRGLKFRRAVLQWSADSANWCKLQKSYRCHHSPSPFNIMSLLFPEVGTVRFIEPLHPRRKTYILIAANIMWLSPETRTVVLLTLVIYFRYMHLRDLAKQDLVCFMLPSGNQSTPIVSIFTGKSSINITNGGFSGELCLIQITGAIRSPTWHRAEEICPMITVPTWEWIACSFSL